MTKQGETPEKNERARQFSKKEKSGTKTGESAPSAPNRGQGQEASSLRTAPKEQEASPLQAAPKGQEGASPLQAVPEGRKVAPLQTAPKEKEAVSPAEESGKPSKERGEEDAEITESSLRYENGRQVAKSGLLGIFIGLAVIVPGISGSTVAVIFRLYRKFLFAIGNLFRKFRRCACFLLPIALGIAAGFVVGFFAVQKIVEVKPFAVVSLFAGLMAGAFPAVRDEIRGEKAKKGRILLFLAGLALPIAVSLISVFAAGGAQSLENLGAPHYILFVVLGYVVAVTQIVPGLSATAILMVCGYFTPLMESVHLSYWKENPQVFLVYLCLVIGFAAGLFTFSKALTKIFEKKKKAAFFAIAGLSLGSVLTMFFNPDMYEVYCGWADGAPMALDILLGVLLFAVGAAAAYAFVRYERKKE